MLATSEPAEVHEANRRETLWVPEVPLWETREETTEH